MPWIPFSRTLLLALGALIGTGAVVMSTMTIPATNMQLEPMRGTVVDGEEFTVSVVVTSDIPVNVFAGDISFDPTALRVQAIDYNTSIADLWAEKPWYSNGDGTLNFIGGTTKSGGFTGDGTLLTITFIALKPDTARINIDEVRILQYDGLGTDATVAEPIDGIFTIAEPQKRPQAVIEKVGGGPKVNIVAKAPSTDLNGDGKQTISDVSIFMTNLLSQNKRADFNRDGRVGTADLSILLEAE